MPTTELSDLTHPAISAALSTAATLLGMEIIFIGGVTADTFTFERVHGSDWPGVEEGRRMPVVDSMCAHTLSGGGHATSDAASDPFYRDCLSRSELDVHSYVGVPIHDRSGTPVGTLCGIDRGHVEVGESTVAVLTELAGIVAAHMQPYDGGAVIRRTPTGWQVAGAPADDLTSAMVLADMLAEGLPPTARPGRPSGDLDEVGQLRLSVVQLEHALAARVLVEQAIGVLAERQRLAPRSSFERLRKAARSRGRRVHDLAREVVASASDPTVPLPPDLAGRR